VKEATTTLPPPFVGVPAGFDPRPREGGDDVLLIPHSVSKEIWSVRAESLIPLDHQSHTLPSPSRYANDLNGFDGARTYREKWAGLRFALALASNDQRSAKINRRFGPDMLDAPVPIGAEKVVAKAIVLGIDQTFQSRFQAGPLSRIHLDLEHGILHALAVIATGLGNPP
jgi:hypothetical protein